jgi:hypothetical protein
VTWASWVYGSPAPLARVPTKLDLLPTIRGYPDGFGWVRTELPYQLWHASRALRHGLAPRPRMVMWHSAMLQHTNVERISFLDALRWFSAPNTGIPLGALLVNPIRPHRVEPRVKKRRPKSFPFMITPRQELRQQLVQPARSG